jgi:hypothetical protein
MVAIEVLGASQLGLDPDHPEVIMERLKGVAVTAV